MHELSVCLSMMDQVTAIAAQHHAKAVSIVRIQLGPLSGVEPQLLMQAFPMASAGTVADGAHLVVEALPVRIRCQRCHADSAAEPNRLVCSECGHWQTQLLSGDELLLESVELTR